MVRLPGVGWTVLLVALPLLAEWFSQFFSGAQWALPLAGLCLLIAKTIEVALAQQKQAAASNLEVMHEERPEQPESLAWRWLVG